MIILCHMKLLSSEPTHLPFRVCNTVKELHYEKMKYDNDMGACCDTNHTKPCFLNATTKQYYIVYVINSVILYGLLSKS